MTDAKSKRTSESRQADVAPAGPSSPTPLALRLDQQLCFALYSASNRVIRLYRPLLDKLGITYPQYLALLVLWEASPRTVGELCQALDLDSGTLTPLLKRLESAGLIKRRRDPADERRVIVALTDQGRELRERAAEVPGAVFCQVGITADELIDLRDRIKRLTAAVECGAEATKPEQ